jgi:hypothetical protein
MNPRHFRYWTTLAAAALIATQIGSTPNAATTPLSSLPLVQSSDLQHLGAFRLPAGQLGSRESDTFEYGGTAAAYDPARNGLFITGHTYVNDVAEVSIPTPIDSTNLGDLSTATILQPFTDATEGKKVQAYYDASGALIQTPLKANGLLVYNNLLIGDVYIYYDATNSQVVSHYTRPTDLSQTGQAKGMYGFGCKSTGFVSGPMALVPPEWQSALGGTVLTMQYGVPIVTRASYGPAAFAFNPADFGQKSRVPCVPLLFYEDADGRRTLGEWNSSGKLWASNDTNGGFVFIHGTRSVLYFINHGIGPFCYDVNGCPPIGERTTSYPYVPSVYAYDALDLMAVKNGSKNPWDLLPYARWALGPADWQWIRSSAYDPATQRIWLVTRGEAGTPDQPIVHMYQANFAAASTSSSKPAAPTNLRVTPN